MGKQNDEVMVSLLANKCTPELSTLDISHA